MTLKQLIEVIDPDMSGVAWLNFFENESELMCKANTCSAFIAHLYDRKVVYVRAACRDEFNVYLEGEI